MQQEASRLTRIAKLRTLLGTDEQRKMSVSSSHQYLQAPPKAAKRQRPCSSSGGAIKKGPASRISSAGGQDEESDGTRQLSPLRQPVIKMSAMRESAETRNSRLKTTNGSERPGTVNRMSLGKKKLTMLQTSEEVSGNRGGRVIPLSNKINSFVSKTGGSFFRDETTANGTNVATKNSTEVELGPKGGAGSRK